MLDHMQKINHLLVLALIKANKTVGIWLRCLAECTLGLCGKRGEEIAKAPAKTHASSSVTDEVLEEWSVDYFVQLFEMVNKGNSGNYRQMSLISLVDMLLEGITERPDLPAFG